MAKTGSYRSSRSINKRKQYSNRYNNDNGKREKKDSSSKNNNKKPNKYPKKPNNKTLKTKKQNKKDVNNRNLTKENIIFTKKLGGNNLITIGLLVKFNIFGRLCKTSRIILTNILRKNMTFLTYNMKYFVNKHEKGNLSRKDITKYVNSLRKKDLLCGNYKKSNYFLKRFEEINLNREIFVIKRMVSEAIFDKNNPSKIVKYKLHRYYQLHINVEKLLSDYIYYQATKYQKYPNYVNLKACCDYKCDVENMKLPKFVLNECGLISVNIFDNLCLIHPHQFKYIAPTFYLSDAKDRLDSYRITFNGKLSVDEKWFTECTRTDTKTGSFWKLVDNSFETPNIRTIPYNSLHFCRIPKELTSTMLEKIKRIM